MSLPAHALTPPPSAARGRLPESVSTWGARGRARIKLKRVLTLSGDHGWPVRLAVGVGILAAGLAAGLGLTMARARRRASADYPRLVTVEEYRRRLLDKGVAQRWPKVVIEP